MQEAAVVLGIMAFVVVNLAERLVVMEHSVLLADAEKYYFLRGRDYPPFSV